jgi:hypothetical protein
MILLHPLCQLSGIISCGAVVTLHMFSGCAPLTPCKATIILDFLQISRTKQFCRLRNVLCPWPAGSSPRATMNEKGPREPDVGVWKLDLNHPSRWSGWTKRRPLGRHNYPLRGRDQTSRSPPLTWRIKVTLLSPWTSLYPVVKYWRPSGDVIAISNVPKALASCCLVPLRSNATCISQ